MDRTLGEWGRKGIGHWVNGVEKPHKKKNTKTNKTTTPDGVGGKKNA